MKHLILSVIWLFSTIGAFSQGLLEIKEPERVLKNVLADNQPETETYSVKNTGTQPVIISRVIPMSSLLKAEWPRGPILPGKTGEISISFLPMQLQKNFNFRIVVYSNASNNRQELTLSGNVTDNPSKPELLYKFNMNGLKFQTNQVNFHKIYTWQTVSDTIAYYNTLHENVTLTVLYKPRHLGVQFVPEQVAPKQKGKLILTYNAPQKNDYGYSYENLVLSVNGSKQYSNRLSIVADLKEDFSRLTPKERANAPAAVVDKPEISFGDLPRGEKADCDFQLTNAGKSPLIIRKTHASCGCTAVTLGQNEIRPGQSTTIRATFDSKGKSGRQYKTITVITNDPQHPELLLRIYGNIKNP